MRVRKFESHRPQNGHKWPACAGQALPSFFTEESVMMGVMTGGDDQIWEGARGALGPIACSSVQPGRPADNTAAYGLLYA